ncbi:AzlD domain-containing protein [Xinfangfangia sp. CPCC 101601]|uniref:AzlD domain-containing protein n=1 Tax=Pseudogemmobacter lacusdianii TaxID=3069608 RepID=A0ABU0VSR3_9RHOB|nr:AzlD domain-containing protein [Xinfangfangia sp. CPCC 101601]MDQ2064761.1 AzlD domain-containing protein [Xinfangfangia sp. CPCC 101601]
MNPDLLIMALLAGLANWGFRALPVILMKREQAPGGVMARFLASTGPAAIATLFVASVLPQIYPAPREILPLAMGVMATFAGFWPRKSIVGGTLAGAAGYAATFWFLGLGG